MPQRKQRGLSLLLMASLALAEPALSMDLESAAQAARAWINLIDSEEYEKSWRLAAPIFTESAPLAEWAKSARTARAPFGQVEERQLSAAEEKPSLPGAPEGRYAILQYRTSFGGDKEAVETVTMMYVQQEWKPSGYFIKPMS